MGIRQKVLGRLSGMAMSLRDIGRDDCLCNICGWSGRAFRMFGAPHKRRPARCPRCDSLERHRLAHHVLAERLDDVGRVLHMAPEPAVARWLRPRAASYVSADLYGQADRKEDLTALSFDKASFDLVYCSHVLEHIPDDMAAMSELRRVLRRGGLAIVQVPIGEVSTDEDGSVIDPEVRLRRWGQRDHVRLYGMDIVTRLESVGFGVEVIDAAELDAALIARHGLVYPSTRQIFVCRP